jgi:hypothetical protein
MDDRAARMRSAASGVPAEYRPLHKYLETRFADAVVLSFGQIEDLLGLTLPGAAYVEPAWWDNADSSGTPSAQATAWVRAQRIATANLGARTVRFERRTA